MSEKETTICPACQGHCFCGETFSEDTQCTFCQGKGRVSLEESKSFLEKEKTNDPLSAELVELSLNMQ